MFGRLLTGSFLFMFCGSLFADPGKIDGVWRASYEKSKTPSADICIKTLSDGKLEGRIENAYPRPGEPAIDKCVNCPGDNKDKSFKGLKVLWGMKPVGKNAWDKGFVLNAETGKTYSGMIKLSKDGKTLDMRGYILGMRFLGETDTWVRQPGNCTISF